MAFQFFKKKEGGPGDTAPAPAPGTSPASAPGSSGAGAPGGPADSSGGEQNDPRKAEVFFNHARTVHESQNFEYATTLWLQGLRLDPSNRAGMEGFLRSATEFGTKQTKGKGPTKAQMENFQGKGPREAYLRNLLQWGVRVTEWSAGIKAMEAAVKANLPEPAKWVGNATLGLAARDAKSKKDDFVALMELFSKVGAFDSAQQAGEIGVRRDPTDARLIAEVRNMSAQATMNKGGYTATGVEGGFRANIRDIEKQKALEEEARVVKTEDVALRLIDRAKADYESRPTDQAAITKYAKALLDRGTLQDEQEAYDLLMRGFEVTKSYQLRKSAGDIKLRAKKRDLRALQEQATTDSSDALRNRISAAELALAEDELAEFVERVRAYPTDLGLKHELGKRLFTLGHYDRAIEQFQAAQGLPGRASEVLNDLALSFEKLGWFDEAEDTFRRALDGHENPNDDAGMNLRYGLLRALQSKANESRNLAHAEEALKLASGIAIQSIGFRDIKERREAIQALVKSLRGVAAGAPGGVSTSGGGGGGFTSGGGGGA